MREKIKEIIQTLVDATKNGDLIWTESNNTLNVNKRSYERDMFCHGEDETKFEICVKYSLSNEVWVMEPIPSLWVRNKDLPGGYYYIHNEKDTITLRDLVKSKFCSDMNPKIEDIESKLGDICKGISLSTYRDSKLTKILKFIKL